MIKKKITIVNDAGLHARPAAALVKLASKFESDFYIHLYGYKKKEWITSFELIISLTGRSAGTCSSPVEVAPF